MIDMTTSAEAESLSTALEQCPVEGLSADEKRKMHSDSIKWSGYQQKGMFSCGDNVTYADIVKWYERFMRDVFSIHPIIAISTRLSDTDKQLFSSKAELYCLSSRMTPEETAAYLKNFNHHLRNVKDVGLKQNRILLDLLLEVCPPENVPLTDGKPNLLDRVKSIGPAEWKINFSNDKLAAASTAQLKSMAQTIHAKEWGELDNLRIQTPRVRKNRAAVMLAFMEALEKKAVMGETARRSLVSFTMQSQPQTPSQFVKRIDLWIIMQRDLLAKAAAIAGTSSVTSSHGGSNHNNRGKSSGSPSASTSTRSPSKQSNIPWA
jgi:hypothetical protein